MSHVENTSIHVIMAGVSGRTGSAVARVLEDSQDIDIVAAVGARTAGQDLGTLLHGEADGRRVYADLTQAHRENGGDVLVDFSVASAAEQLLKVAIPLGLRPVCGTTGLSSETLAEIARLCEKFSMSAAVIANFSLGAALLMRCARMAKTFFNDAEIIELHSAHKRDKPSGSALLLREKLGDGEMPIHSVRLPGLVAHQEVLFGGEGELVTLRHDALSRDCYAPGVLRVVRAIAHHQGLVRDMEAFLPN